MGRPFLLWRCLTSLAIIVDVVKAIVFDGAIVAIALSVQSFELRCPKPVRLR